MEQEKILARLHEASGRIAQYPKAYWALPCRDYAHVYPLVWGYIRDRFLLTEEMCSGDRLLDLADISLRYMLELKRQGIDPGQISRSCSGASSVISKKVLLIKAMQEAFGFSMTPQEFAQITTVGELTAFLCSATPFTSPVPAAPAPVQGFDPYRIRGDFPALSEKIHGHPLVYLDNSATGQMPRPVMEAVQRLEACRGNIHRGIHTLSGRCTDAYEHARNVCAEFLGVFPGQLTFTSGTTDGINRVAQAFSARPGGIVVTALEHHSNFVPWQQLCLRENRPFRVCPCSPEGVLDLSALDELLTPDVGLLAVTQCSNVTGALTPIDKIIRLAHSRGIPVLVDGAQAICHIPVNLRAMDCDYYVCSGHKLGSPFGIGLLYCREPLPPTVFGGGMVERVTQQETTFLSSREAGTPNVSGAVGLSAAIEYRKNLPEGWEAHERALLAHLRTGLLSLPGIHLYSPEQCCGCLSFTMEGLSPFDAAALLDQQGIALRSGDHCAQPLHQALGTPYTLRVSPAYYNTFEEIDWLISQLKLLLSGENRH